MIDLSQFEPLPTTTEGLIEILEHWDPTTGEKQIPIDPAILSVKRLMEGMPDPDFSRDYRAIGDVNRKAFSALVKHIHAHQKQASISGIHTKTVTIAGESLTYPELHPALTWVDSDLPTLKAAVPSLLAYFHRLGSRLGYQLVCEEWIGEETEYRIAFSQQVQAESEAALLGGIKTECLEYGKIEGGWRGFPVDKDPPDKIQLLLTRDFESFGPDVFSYLSPNEVTHQGILAL